MKIECHMEQLINLLADLAAQPRLLTTTRPSGAGRESERENRKRAGLAVGGVTPRQSAPDNSQKKGRPLNPVRPKKRSRPLNQEIS